jgi:hypothetical protein
MAKNGPKQPAGGHVSGQSNRPLSRPAHALTHEQLAAELDADILSGLTAQEAKVRLEQYGRNDLGEEEGVQPLKIIVAQIANAMTLVPVPIPSLGQEVEVLMAELGANPGHGGQFRDQVMD